MLRLTIAAGPTAEAVKAIFHGIYGEGLSPGEPETLRVLGERLGVSDPERAVQSAAVKEELCRLRLLKAYYQQLVVLIYYF